jgi:hypothetical protein
MRRKVAAGLRRVRMRAPDAPQPPGAAATGPDLVGRGPLPREGDVGIIPSATRGTRSMMNAKRFAKMTPEDRCS